MSDREYERRYRISEEEAQWLRSSQGFGPPVTVTDLTFGPYGRESIDRVGWVVRLRSTAGQFRLGLKEVLDQPWAWEEIWFGISNPDAAVRMLTRIGLVPGLVLDRTRERCMHGGYRLCLDSVRWLGTFIEVESESFTRGQRTDEVLQGMELAHRPPCDTYGAMLNDLLVADATVASEHDAALRAAVAEVRMHPTDRDGFRQEG